MLLLTHGFTCLFYTGVQCGSLDSWFIQEIQHREEGNKIIVEGKKVPSNREGKVVQCEQELGKLHNKIKRKTIFGKKSHKKEKKQQYLERVSMKTLE